MILDTLNNAAVYRGTHPLFEAAFTFLDRAVKEDLPEGRYELQGSDLYAMVQVYPIDSENPNVEFHNKYIDVQYIVEGCEHMGWADRADAPADAKYSEEYDIGLFPMETTADFDVKAGSFAIFFPGDLHKPKMLSGSSAMVKKIVVKVKA